MIGAQHYQVQLVLCIVDINHTVANTDGCTTPLTHFAHWWTLGEFSSHVKTLYKIHYQYVIKLKLEGKFNVKAKDVQVKYNEPDNTTEIKLLE